MKRIKSLLLCFVFLAGMMSWIGCAKTNIPAEPSSNDGQEINQHAQIDFIDNFRDAQSLASQEHKPILIFFMEPDCVFSQKMLEITFSNQNIVELSKNFVCVKIDMNAVNSEEICERFDVVGSPTIQFVSSQGTPLQRITQNQPAEKLEQQMKTILYSLAWRIEQSILR